MLIVGGDLELAEKIDAAKVGLVEARAPTVSLADRDDIVRGFQGGNIFRQVREGMTRTQLQQNVLAVNGMIPSIRTTLYLEHSLLAMKVLINPSRCQTREALQHMWRGFPMGRAVLEYADGMMEMANVSMEEQDNFQLAYIQLWMFSMRNYPRLTNLVPKTDSKHSPLAMLHPACHCGKEGLAVYHYLISTVNCLALASAPLKLRMTSF